MRNLSMIAVLAVALLGVSRCERIPKPGHGDGGSSSGEACGPVQCDAGKVCCNESCGICTEPGGFCTEQFCEPDPDPDPDPNAPACGGIAGTPCPGAGMCVDDPSDDCDPENGGADCGGVCSCSGVLILCIEGTVFNEDPNVCECEGTPDPPEGEPCGPVNCESGQVCCNESCGICTEPGGFCTEQFCEPDPDPDPDPNAPFCGGIAGIPCPGAGMCVDDPSDDCDPENGGADCGGLCTCSGIAVLCIEGTVFNEDPNVCECEGTPDPPAPPFCGGIAGFTCPGEGECVDDPSDDCDPENGGADCGGICECNVGPLIDCKPGFVFDDSPSVCACVN